MIHLAGSILGKVPEFLAAGKVEASQLVPNSVVSVKQIDFAGADYRPAIAGADGTVQGTLGPSFGQVRNKPFSADVLCSWAPFICGQSSAKAQAMDNEIIAAMIFILAFIVQAPFPLKHNDDIACRFST